MNMNKFILTALFGMIGLVGLGQFAPTSAKTAFKNGVALGSRDSTAYGANDSLVVTIDRNGRLLWRGLGANATWRFVPFGTDTLIDTRFVRLQKGNMYQEIGKVWVSDTLRSRLLRASKVLTDSVQALGSAGIAFYTNSGTKSFSYGAGGSSEVTFNGFAGYDANRSGSFTDFSFTNKKFVDSADGLRKLISDTLFTNGYTTRGRTKHVTDSLGAVITAGDALKKNIADTFFTTGYTTRARTKQVIDSLGSVKVNFTNGTTNTVPKFTGASTIGNSSITDNGSLITLGSNTYVNGGLSVGTSLLLNGSTINVARAISGITNSNYISATPEIGLAATGAVNMYYSLPTTQAAAFTLQNLRHFVALQGTLGASSVITEQTGFLAGSSLIGAVINYGFRGAISSGTNRWNLYMDGTANNYLNGRTLFGTTTDNGVDRAQFNGSILVGNLRTSTNTISSTNTNGDIILDANGTGVIQANDGIVASVGVTAQRGRFTSLVVNKDSIPITTSNFWALQVDSSGTPGTNRINRRDISAVHTGAVAFDTSSRQLTITQIGGGTTSVVIPRGTASGTSGITALSASRTGNLVTVSGDNGSSTIFSVRDADSSTPIQSLTASFGISGSPFNGTSPQTWLVDTSVISTKANVTASLLPKLSLTDTAAMLSGYQRQNFALLLQDTATAFSNYNRKSDTATMLLPYLLKSDTASMLLPFVQYSDTANQTSGYLRKNFALLLQDTASAYNNYLRKSDTLTMLSNRLKISDTLTMLSPYARTANLPSLAPYLLRSDSLSGGYTTWLLTKKKIDSLGAIVGLKLNTSDTATMLNPYTRVARFTDSLALVQGRIQTKLAIADTAAMLIPFVQYSDTASIVAGYVRSNRFTDSLTNVQTRIQTKLAIADTAAMLSAYTRLQRFTDSLTAVQARIQTKQPLGAYITLTDSSTILAGRWLPNRSNDTATVLRALVNTKLNISDTASMLANRLKASDTLTMLSNYRRKTTLIENAELRNTTISGIALGGSLNNLSAGNGLVGTAYNGGTAQSWRVDTSVISTKANVTGVLAGYATIGANALKLNIIDTSTMLANRLKISDTLTMLSRYLRKSDTATMLAPFVQYSDTTTLLAGRWLPNRSADSTAVLRALINTKGVGNGTVTSIATSNATGIIGGTITATGTLSIDTIKLATRDWRQKGVDSLNGLINLRVRYTDTATMLAPFVQYSDTANQMSGYLRKNFALLLQDTATAFSVRPLNNRFLDSIASIRSLANTKTSNTGTVTSIATNSGTGISGGTITTTGTLAIDTVLLSTRAWRQKGVDSLNGLINARVRFSDTASMLSNYARASNLGSYAFRSSGLAELSGALFTGGITGTSITLNQFASATSNIIPLILNNNSDGGVRISFSNSATNLLANITAGVLSSGAGTDDGVLSFSTATNGVSFERLTLKSGNAGFDAINPEAKLQVGSSTAPSQIRVYGGSAGVNSPELMLYGGSSGHNWTIRGNHASALTIGKGTLGSYGSDIFNLSPNGDLTIPSVIKSAGINQPISLKTANYTLTTNDHTVIFDVTAASRTATLPAGVEGQIFVIKKKGSNSNTVTITPNGSQTVEGLSSYVVSGCDGTAITIQFLSGNWEIIYNNYVTSCF